MVTFAKIFLIILIVIFNIVTVALLVLLVPEDFLLFFVSFVIGYAAGALIKTIYNY